ncbi:MULTISPECIES: DUF6541 family protein [unclassified Actinomyces]|uniref:DUF6541 family protein n=1 Tax=unclassified Actinomyces TaxID=2609248 RepID=UPI002017C90C|nr:MULTISPECIES: DUF6541 family protein [unclassified Actinomyces]MCL3776983.1 hypothetical protein [Actinomyces sp. AC-20-1]MCL3789038.1 hypothetical protein [Actinomyces sp. 187325]MCL3791447.1 hypothetical protein [Actinomyces sp. 186855]MCL3794022.1 hypothetical protein [Actinomyces sp. 217892]
MNNLGTWAALLPQALVLLGLLLVPGGLVLRSLGYRGLLLAACAAPTSMAAIALLGLVYEVVGIRFEPVPVVIGLTVIVLLAWTGGRLARGSVPAALPDPEVARGRDTLLPLAAVLLAWLVLVRPVLTGWDPSLPGQQIDPVFHHNLAWTITQTGNASLLTGASWSASLLYSTRAYYPLVWHAMVALASEGGTELVEATNALVVLVPLIWCLGVAACAAQALPRFRLAPVVAVAAALMFPVYPAYMLYTRQLWPNALGYAVFPAVLALLLHAVRLITGPAELGRRRALLVLVAVATAASGAAATYPAAVFSILLTGTPLLIAVIVLVCRFVWAHRRHAAVRALLVMSATVPALLVAFLVSGGATLILARLVRETGPSASSLPMRLFAMATLWPRGRTGAADTLRFACQLPLVAASLVIAWRNRRTRWLVWAWVLPMVVLAGTYFPLGPVSALTGLWYNDPYRIMPLVALVSSVLLAVAARWLLMRRAPAWSQFRSTVAVIALVLVPALAAQPAAARVARSAYDTTSTVLVRTLSAEEVRMIESLRGRLDPSLMVLGDPAAGAGYVQAIAGNLSVFPHLTFRAADTDALYLAEHFDDIAVDPRICWLVHHYGIGYFYEDEPGQVPGIDVVGRAPGLYGVDTSEGFEPVASGGTATVYRITACGTVAAPQRFPWVVNRPFEPLLGSDGALNTFTPEGRVVQD